MVKKKETIEDILNRIEDDLITIREKLDELEDQNSDDEDEDEDED